MARGNTAPELQPQETPTEHPKQDRGNLWEDQGAEKKKKKGRGEKKPAKSAREISEAKKAERLAREKAAKVAKIAEIHNKIYTEMEPEHYDTKTGAHLLAGEKGKHESEGTTSYGEETPFLDSNKAPVEFSDLNLSKKEEVELARRKHAKRKEQNKQILDPDTTSEEDWGASHSSAIKTDEEGEIKYDIEEPFKPGIFNRFISDIRNRWDSRHDKGSDKAIAKLGVEPTKAEVKEMAQEAQQEEVGEKMMEKTQLKRHEFEKMSEPDSGPSRAEERHKISKGKIAETSYWANQTSKIEGATILPEYIMKDLSEIYNQPDRLVEHFILHTELISPDVIRFLGSENQLLDKSSIQKLVEAKTKELREENSTLKWTAILKKRRNNTKIEELDELVK